MSRFHDGVSPWPVFPDDYDFKPVADGAVVSGGTWESPIPLDPVTHRLRWKQPKVESVARIPIPPGAVVVVIQHQDGYFDVSFVERGHAPQGAQGGGS